MEPKYLWIFVRGFFYGPTERGIARVAEALFRSINAFLSFLFIFAQAIFRVNLLRTFSKDLRFRTRISTASTRILFLPFLQLADVNYRKKRLIRNRSSSNQIINGFMIAYVFSFTLSKQRTSYRMK